MIATTLFLAAMTLISERAEAHEWMGTQVMLPVSAEIGITKSIGFRGHVTGFFVPERGVSLAFIYAGPTFSADLKDVGIWISPQIGSYLGWFEGSDALGPSLWLNLDLLDGKLGIFAEGELVFAARSTDKVFYGYYALDGYFLGKMNVGAQVEQVNMDPIVGPHVGVSQGPLHFELQYYVGSDTHTLRLVTGLGF